jgi:cytochrome c peroxidase
MPLEFVALEKKNHEINPEWHKLAQFWNSPRPDQVAASVGLAPLIAGAIAAASPAPMIRIKVPLGLDDPQPYLPAYNPPTLGKWKLGQALFFDETWLEAQPGVSCASCHHPKEGFTDRQRVEHNSFNVPTLINCLYNRYQFWDGRACCLEEVVQRTLEDERADASVQPFRHVWGGVIGRLQNGRYRYQFIDVFGTPPTADAVGKALATYLRTLLAGNSLYDRATWSQTRAGVERTVLLEGLLNDTVLAELGRSGAKKADVARELDQGHRLFFNIGDTRRANCVACHSGSQFTDGGFHNLGIDPEPAPGKETGRFAVVGVGQKDRYLIGAYKTPTLRSLLRTAPYYHDGSAADLATVVRHHAQRHRFLDPEMLDERDRVRGDDLRDEEVEALVLFLHALNGEDVAGVVWDRSLSP